MSRYDKHSLLEKLSLFAVATILSMGIVHSAMAAPSQTPLFLTNASKPIITLVLSVDHELYKKAYNDYSNLDGGTLTSDDTTYRNSFKYYGYFDSDWCYTYSENSGNPQNSYFTPAVAAINHKCVAGQNYWSGNFLNWATMTRVDVLRKVLYGGKRSVDSDSQTILERSYLPKDTHAFAKVYAKSDMNELTPYTYNVDTLSAISMCNVSTGVNGYPIFKVAKGAWRQWAASESVQCEYKVPGTDGKIPKEHFSRPAESDKLSQRVVKVDVCVTGKDADSPRCKQYGSAALKKPFGILQTYGESGDIKFSLVTGSYKANTKGGVLRREASLIAKNPTPSNDEVNLATGQFNNVNGIIKNIDSFRIATYSSGKYTDCNTYSITVDTVKGQQTNGERCSDWGNPLAEIYLEALRYLTGNKKASDGFDVNDAAAIGSTYPGVPGLTQSTWGNNMVDPWPSSQWCAKCFTVVISTGANSFDGDDLSSVKDLPGLNDEAALEAITNSIGTNEYSDFANRNFFAGGTENDKRYCKPTRLGSLSAFRGMCPEQPATEGSYHIAGLAYYAHTHDLRDHDNDQKVTTYAIDLAESLPSFVVPVGNTKVEFLPACEAKKSGGDWQTCSLIDVTVESLTYDNNQLVAGSYLFYWEDSLWGNDYDFDGAQRISFCVGASCGSNAGVNSTQIKIVNSIPYAYAGNDLHFSYNIVGVGNVVTTKVISNQSTSPTEQASNMTDFDGGILTPWADRPGGENFNTFNSPPDPIPNKVTRVESVFTASSTSSSAVLLKKPLFYVAKYGGFTDKNGNNRPDDDDPATTTVNESEWDADGDEVPDNYFSVKNPALLESSLESVFKSILGSVASASSAAVSSTRLSEGAFVYQARFNSTYWSGELVAYQYNANGVLSELPILNSTDQMKANNNDALKIWTSTSNTPNTNAVLIDVDQSDTEAWNVLSAQQKADLASAATTTLTAAQISLGQKRLNWIRGASTYEDLSDNAVANRLFRARTNLVEQTDGSKVRVRNIIGDIVNSSPVYDGAKDLKYETLPVGGSSYVTYLNNKRLKRSRIFVGANDGMIHAFDAETLDYLFSYLPPSVYPHLDNLTRTDYGTSANEHKFLLDGQLTVGDAFINNQWRTILVAASGAGGKNIFALDITGNTPKLLFNFDSSSQPKIGHIMGKPVIAPMKNNRFAVIFGNGYDAATTTTSLFVVDLESPTSTTYTKIIDANAVVAVTNGLSTPALLPDIMGRVEYAYAGDLNGNLWRFDLRSDNPGNWDAGGSIFTAEDEGGHKQPIFAAPTLGYNALRNNRIMVYFGTGKYFEDTDTALGQVINSFYAVIDDLQSSPYSRSDLAEKEISTLAGGSRTLSNDDVELWSTVSNKGWYIDFPLGERVTVKPLLIYDRLIFPTLIPSADPCSFGGTSWLMEAVAVGDKASVNPMLGEMLENDYLILGDLSFGIVPTLDDTGQIIISRSDGKVTPQSVNIKSGIGRVNWRQLD